MKISVRQSGGFAGIPLELGTLDTAQSPQGPRLEQLVQQTGFFALPAQLAGDDTAVGADLAQYELTIHDGAQEHVVSFADTAGPEAQPLREIVQAVTQSPH